MYKVNNCVVRTRMLMVTCTRPRPQPPEPHLLPLIHARLYLVTAIRQVMHNGLTLLGIEPLEQL